MHKTPPPFLCSLIRGYCSHRGYSNSLYSLHLTARFYKRNESHYEICMLKPNPSQSDWRSEPATLSPAQLYRYTLVSSNVSYCGLLLVIREFGQTRTTMAKNEKNEKKWKKMKKKKLRRPPDTHRVRCICYISYVISMTTKRKEEEVNVLASGWSSF